MEDLSLNFTGFICNTEMSSKQAIMSFSFLMFSHLYPQELGVKLFCGSGFYLPRSFKGYFPFSFQCPTNLLPGGIVHWKRNQLII